MWMPQSVFDWDINTGSVYYITVTMHEGVCEQEFPSQNRYAESLVVLFAQAEEHFDKKPYWSVLITTITWQF